MPPPGRRQHGTELAHTDAARRALSFDDEIGDLLVNAVDDEFATERRRSLAEQSDALTAAVNELVDSLNGSFGARVALSGPNQR